MFIVDVALGHTCAEIRSKAAEGQITSAERDLLIDGAVAGCRTAAPSPASQLRRACTPSSTNG